MSAPAPESSAPFDVEAVRHAGRRLVVERRLPSPTLVLGSTQRPDVVDADAARRAGVEVKRRRSGGGAVLLLPGDHLWFDVWLPREDPLFVDDVIAAPGWVGDWWVAALGRDDRVPLEVQRSSCAGSSMSALVCFAGLGPGEVLADGRKLVGVAQWRARQGSLFHVAAYWRWDPTPLFALLALDAGCRREVARRLPGAAIGLEAVPGAAAPAAGFVDRLLAHLPPGEWDVRRDVGPERGDRPHAGLAHRPSSQGPSF